MLSLKEQRRHFYLVSVTEFTNLSGDQVSLVLLHVYGVYVILNTKKAPFKKKGQARHDAEVTKAGEKANRCDTTSSLLSFFLFRRWESSSCDGALSSVAYSRINPSIAPLTI